MILGRGKYGFSENTDVLDVNRAGRACIYMIIYWTIRGGLRTASALCDGE